MRATGVQGHRALGLRVSGVLGLGPRGLRFSVEGMCLEPVMVGGLDSSNGALGNVGTVGDNCYYS